MVYRIPCKLREILRKVIKYDVFLCILFLSLISGIPIEQYRCSSRHDLRNCVRFGLQHFRRKSKHVIPPPPPVNARGPFYWNGITLIPAWLSNYIRYKDRGWNCMSIPQLQQLHRWNLEMNKRFHPTLFWACDYLSMQRCKLIHVSKRDPSSHLLCKLKDGASVVMEL